jgi:DNA segregation ATPase FtsK/SpoIIIE, S-DNA-T family
VARSGSSSRAKTNTKSQSKQSEGRRSGKRSEGRAASPSEKRALRSKSADSVQDELPLRQPIVNDSARRTIAGIILLVLAIALLLIVIAPAGGMVTSFASTALRLTLGIGAYILPLVLAIIAITFIAKFQDERISSRSAIGLGLIFIAVLGLFSLFTPLSAGDSTVPSTLFSQAQLMARGGYIGAGIAWAGLSLFGIAVSTVVLIGLIAIALVIIGFSVTKFLNTIHEKARERAKREEEQLGVLGAEPYAKNEAAALSDKRSNRPDRQRVDRTNMPTRALRPNSADNTKTTTDSQQMTRQLGAREKALQEAKAAEAERAKTQALEDAKIAKSRKAETSAEDSEEGSSYTLPSFDLLKVSKPTKRTKAMELELADTAANLQRTLEDFGIQATVVDWVAGPTVTLFEIDLPPGVRVSRITALNDDIALALAAPGVRIFAPVPGTHYVGIEVPNITRENVLLGDVLKHAQGGPLDMAIGKDVEGNPVVCDLAKMPHILIGGTTGSGKSVGINSMIMSMIMRATPDEVRFIMIDPKRVEFSPYNGIPHLYVPVVTEAKEAASALSWGVAEMERRLKVFSKVGARNINEYNDMVLTGALDDESAAKLPYIVIVIDELADLMMNVGKEVEFSISRIAQLARAAGIHLIVATQRPSANVVTGLIKANITNRMAFNVASGLDSRVILDVSGAESLIGKGDLLLSKPEYAKPRRIQGCWVSPEEIAAVVDAVKSQGEPEYHTDILKTNLITLGDSQPDGSGGSVSADDPLIWDAADIVVASGMGSTSNIQRKLKVGYSRAGRIMDMLEEKGVVGPPNGSKPRDVLVDAMELEALKAFEANDQMKGKE